MNVKYRILSEICHECLFCSFIDSEENQVDQPHSSVFFLLFHIFSFLVIFLNNVSIIGRSHCFLHE